MLRTNINRHIHSSQLMGIIWRANHIKKLILFADSFEGLPVYLLSFRVSNNISKNDRSITTLYCVMLQNENKLEHCSANFHYILVHCATKTYTHTYIVFGQRPRRLIGQHKDDHCSMCCTAYCPAVFRVRFRMCACLTGRCDVSTWLTPECSFSIIQQKT